MIGLLERGIPVWLGGRSLLLDYFILEKPILAPGGFVVQFPHIDKLLLLPTLSELDCNKLSSKSCALYFFLHAFALRQNCNTIFFHNLSFVAVS